MADTTPGDKYIIFITDGQEDFCDDALEICASDSTVGALQAAYTAEVKTIVFGLQTTQFNLPAAVLQAFANAGAGEPTVAALSSGLDTTAIFDQCQGVMPWKTDLTASGPPDHARTDRDGGDVRDDGGTDQALQAERLGSDHAGDAAVDRARGRQELHVRSQRRSAAVDQGRPQRS